MAILELGDGLVVISVHQYFQLNGLESEDTYRHFKTFARKLLISQVVYSMIGTPLAVLTLSELPVPC